MHIIFIVLFILFTTALLTMYFIDNYNKLVIYRNQLNELWNHVYNEINYRFELAIQYKNALKHIILIDEDNVYENLFEQFKNTSSSLQIMNASISLEKELKKFFILLEDKGIKNIEWDNAFIQNKERLNNSRINYNDVVLKLSNKIRMFPSSIIAAIFKFKTWDYFRTEE